MLISKSNILFIPQIRDDILKYQWTQDEAIKYDKVNYVLRPCTIKILLKAIEYKSDKVIAACIDDIDSDTLQNHYILYNNIYNLENLKKFETKLKHLDNDSICFQKFFENNCVDIVDYLLGERKCSINYIFTIYTIDIYRLLIDKYQYSFNNFMYDEWVIIDLLNNNEPNFEYSLIDAIDNRFDTVVDYILYKRNYGITENEICELIEKDIPFLSINSYNIDQHVNSEQIAYTLLQNKNVNMIQDFINAGFNANLILKLDLSFL